MWRRLVDGGMEPKSVGQLTLNQAWVLCQEEKTLKRRRTVTGTAEQLRAKGLLQDDPEATTLFDVLFPRPQKPGRAERRERIQAAVKVARG